MPKPQANHGDEMKFGNFVIQISHGLCRYASFVLTNVLNQSEMAVSVAVVSHVLLTGRDREFCYGLWRASCCRKGFVPER